VWWHDNGQKRYEGDFKDGEKVEGSDKYWNRKGEPAGASLPEYLLNQLGKEDLPKIKE